MSITSRKFSSKRVTADPFSTPIFSAMARLYSLCKCDFMFFIQADIPLLKSTLICQYRYKAVIRLSCGCVFGCYINLISHSIVILGKIGSPVWRWKMLRKTARFLLREKGSCLPPISLRTKLSTVLNSHDCQEREAVERVCLKGEGE